MNEGCTKGKWGTETFPIIADTIRRSSNGTSLSYDYIPIDYINVEVVGIDSEKFLNNSNLTFTPILKDSDVLVKYISVVDGMKIQISIPSNRTTLSGSIHKFWNGGHHNYNDFDSNAFKLSIDRLCSLFEIDTSDLRILALEYGVNIKIDFPVHKILNNCFLHKGKDVEVSKSDNRGKYHQFEHDRYILKLYDKGKQYRLNDLNLLRIEVKELNWTSYRKNGIVTMKNFIQCDKTIFIQNLIEQWTSVIFLDFNAPSELIDSYYLNINYWRELRDKVKTKKISRTSFHRYWNVLKEHNKKHGVDLQNIIAQLIIDKIDELQDVTFSIFNEKTNNIIEKICPITGIRISEQKPDSFLLSHSTLYKLKSESPDIFDEIRIQFLTSRWLNKDIKIQVREIAHNIRSRYFHSINRNKKHDQFGQLRFEFQL